MARIGRPKEEAPRGTPCSARLNEREWELFERLIEDRQKEVRAALQDPSKKLGQGEVLRWLIAREVAARGLDRDEPTAPAGQKGVPAGPTRPAATSGRPGRRAAR